MIELKFCRLTYIFSLNALILAPSLISWSLYPIHLRFSLAHLVAMSLLQLNNLNLSAKAGRGIYLRLTGLARIVNSLNYIFQISISIVFYIYRKYHVRISVSVKKCSLYTYAKKIYKPFFLCVKIQMRIAESFGNTQTFRP